LIKLNGIARRRLDLLELDLLAFFNTVLFAAALDYCVHYFSSQLACSHMNHRNGAEFRHRNLVV
jgi:hypothetical protein